MKSFREDFPAMVDELRRLSAEPVPIYIKPLPLKEWAERTGIDPKHDVMYWRALTRVIASL